MLTTDKAFDMLPHVVDLYDKIDLDQYRKNQQALNNKDADKMELGIAALKYIFKNVHKAKEEVFHIVAIAQDKSIDEVRGQSLPRTILAVKDIFSDKEMVDFFKQAMQ